MSYRKREHRDVFLGVLVFGVSHPVSSDDLLLLATQSEDGQGLDGCFLASWIAYMPCKPSCKLGWIQTSHLLTANPLPSTVRRAWKTTGCIAVSCPRRIHTPAGIELDRAGTSDWAGSGSL